MRLNKKNQKYGVHMQINTVRIIAGQYKGLKIPVLEQEGLRPTTDRAKETIFSHLGNLENYAILDLFAGSGALGYEAISRGATSLVQVENNQIIVDNLKQVNTHFSQNIKLYQQDALAFLEKNSQQFDLIFLDPPYQSSLLTTSIEYIFKYNTLKTNGYIYAEYNDDSKIKHVGFEVVKSGNFGQIKYKLLKKSSFLF